MTTYQLKQIPSTWDDARDVPFFRLVCDLFSSEFVYGAGVLLAQNDEAPAPLPA